MVSENMTLKDCQSLASMLRKGLLWRVHMRAPGSSEEEYKEVLEMFPSDVRHQLSLHDHHSLAIEYGIGGVHLNSRNPEVPEGFSGMISRSCHSLKELEESDGCDYFFLSPIFDCISKSGYKSAFSSEELAKSVPDIPTPVFALGGVDLSKIETLDKLGFSGGVLAGVLQNAMNTSTLGQLGKAIMMNNVGLQYITQGKEEEDYILHTQEVLAGGCRWIQLRMKSADDETFVNVGRRIRKLCNAYGAVFILDDRAWLVNELNADGVHLGKNDMGIAEARDLLGPDKIIGATANDFETLSKSVENGADYIGVGPLRFTLTKEKLSPLLGFQGFESILRKCRAESMEIPVVAIGGIVKSDVVELTKLGVKGIAVSGGLVNAIDTEAETKEFINMISQNDDR